MTPSGCRAIFFLRSIVRLMEALSGDLFRQIGTPIPPMISGQQLIMDPRGQYQGNVFGSVQMPADQTSALPGDPTFSTARYFAVMDPCWLPTFWHPCMAHNSHDNLSNENKLPTSPAAPLLSTSPKNSWYNGMQMINRNDIANGTVYSHKETACKLISFHSHHCGVNRKDLLMMTNNDRNATGITGFYSRYCEVKRDDLQRPRDVMSFFFNDSPHSAQCGNAPWMRSNYTCTSSSNGSSSSSRTASMSMTSDEDQELWNLENEFADHFNKERQLPYPGYRCHMCGLTGHLIKFCPLSANQNQVRITTYQGPRFSIGDFKCPKCGNKWTNKRARANRWQKCKQCLEPTYPKKMRPLQRMAEQTETPIAVAIQKFPTFQGFRVHHQLSHNVGKTVCGDF